MPELAIYFTIVLSSIAVALSVVIGIGLVLTLYHAIRWTRESFEGLAHRHLGSRRGYKKAAIIVLPTRSKTVWNSVRSI
jgi:hypothetical protein